MTIYLDYNATSPIRPGVKAAMDALGDAPLNPSSIHGAGRTAKKYLEDARATIASALGAFPNEVLFTASGSEANNLVLRAFAPTHALLTSAIEHVSIGKTASLLGGATIPVDGNGLVKLDVLQQMLSSLNGKPALVSVMLANNETGVIQPIAEVARIARAHGALVHCDAVQALGKITLDWGLLGVDMLTIAAHKAGGPVGAAALLIRNDLAIKPLISGGGQELGRRAGTENIRAIVGLAACVKEVAACEQAAEWIHWRDTLANTLVSGVAGAQVAGAGAARLPQTLCIEMPGVRSETQLMNFDLAGIAVSAGSACSSGRVAASHVLSAMGLSSALAESFVRVSWGWATSHEEITKFAAVWQDMAKRLVKRAA